MKFTLISIFLLASFAVAFSLKCYVCSDCSGNGEETDCGADFDRCMKFYGDKKTVRTCSNKAACDVAEVACKALKKKDKDADCEVGCCDTDLCNSGAAPSFSVFLVSLCSLFAVTPFFK